MGSSRVDYSSGPTGGVLSLHARDTGSVVLVNQICLFCGCFGCALHAHDHQLRLLYVAQSCNVTSLLCSSSAGGKQRKEARERTMQETTTTVSRHTYKRVVKTKRAKAAPYFHTASALRPRLSLRLLRDRQKTSKKWALTHQRALFFLSLTAVYCSDKN